MNHRWPILLLCLCLAPQGAWAQDEGEVDVDEPSDEPSDEPTPAEETDEAEPHDDESVEEGEEEGDAEPVEEPPPPPDPRVEAEQAALEALRLGRHVEGATGLGALIDEDPLAPEVPRWRGHMVEAWLTQGQVADALAQAARLQADTRGDWAAAHVDQPDTLTEAQASLEAVLLLLANHYRDFARDNPAEAADLFETAVQWYTALLDRIESGDRAQEALIELALVHYETGQLEQAWTRAMEAVDASPGTLRCRLACELAIQAGRRASYGDGDEAWAGRQLAALDRFTELYPTDFLAQEMLLEAALLRHEQGRVDEALPQLQQVVALDPRAPAAQQAAELMLSSLHDRREWTALAAALDELLAIEILGNEAFRGELTDMRERTAFQMIEEQTIASEDWEGAAAAYEQFSEDYPDSSLADRALFNAIVYYYKAGRSRTASQLAKALRRRFPRSPYADRLQL